MTCMLGDRTCMESLRKDITDLQGTVINVFSRVGAVRSPSWKFPDKVACDLDLVQLLDRYDYMENDADFTQLSHMVLLELVIDRLLLLLQSFEVYTEFISSDGPFTPKRNPGPSMSIGLTVQKYWRSLMKLGAIHKQAKSTHENTNVAKQRIPENELSYSTNLQSPPSQTESHHHVSIQQETTLSIAKDTRTMGSQTLESALVPCDACAIAQSSLKEVSDTIVSVCRSQNLPSSLTKIQDVLPTGGILTPAEMRYWASEESKDLARISKHLSELTQVIQPLKSKLEAAKIEKETLQQAVESCKIQLQSQREELQKQAKDNERKLEEKGQQNQDVVDKLERDKAELKRGAAFLEERVSILKEELKTQHCTIRDLELARQKLISEMQSMVHKEEVSKLEKKMSDMKVQLEITLQRLRESEEAVSKERAWVESLENHKESLQTKQRSLLQQLDRLSQECENLQGGLVDADEERAKLEEQIEQMQREEESLKSQLNDQQAMINVLQQEKVTLEKSVKEVTRQLSELQGCLQEQKEREKLLVSFPDLHPLPEFESSGDITEDMEKQLQANSIRISILEEENSKLRASLHRLGEINNQGPMNIISQTHLWTRSPTQDPLSPESQITYSRSNIAKSPTPKQNFVLVPRDATKSSAVSHLERKASHQSLNLVNFPPANSPIAAYARLKQVKGRNRTPSSDRK